MDVAHAILKRFRRTLLRCGRAPLPYTDGSRVVAPHPDRGWWDAFNSTLTTFQSFVESCYGMRLDVNLLEMPPASPSPSPSPSSSPAVAAVEDSEEDEDRLEVVVVDAADDDAAAVSQDLAAVSQVASASSSHTVSPDLASSW